MGADKNWGVVNADNQYLIEPIYKRIDVGKEGLFEVETQDGLVGIFDYDGKMLVPEFFKSMEEDDLGGIYVQTVDGRKKIYDLDGNQQCDRDFLNVYTIWKTSFRIEVKEEENTILLSTSCEPISDLPYADVSNFDDEFLRVYDSAGLVGLISHKGVEVIPVIYNTLNRFTDDTILASVDGLYKLLNEDGTEHTKEGFKQIYKSDTGRISAINISGNFGYIEKNGSFSPLWFDLKFLDEMLEIRN